MALRSTGLHVNLEGFEDLKEAVERLSDKEKLGRAINRVWHKEAKTRLQPYLRKKMKHRLGGKGTLARSYTVGVRGNTVNTVMMEVYSRAAPSGPHEDGGVITPKSGGYLAIPTDNASGLVRGKRITTGGKSLNTKKRLTPRMLKNSFVKTSKKGVKIIFQRVEAGDKKLKKYFMKARGSYPAGQIVPMFILLKKVTLRPRTNIRGYFPREIPRIADKTLEAIERLWGKA